MTTEAPAGISKGLILRKEKAPSIVRSGGGGGQPHEWEKIIGPTISAEPGENFLVYLYPEPDRQVPEGGWPEDDLKKARQQAAARAASIANRYYHHVPEEHVETAVRQRSDGSYGVWVTHHGAMTEEARAKLAQRRRPRQKVTEAAQDDPAPDGASEATQSSPAPATAAERAKAAAKRQGAR
jgi:hypothetical protein